MESTVTHFCYIELNGNVITKTKDGDIVADFTGNWTILHKIQKFATMDAASKAKYRVTCPEVVIGTIAYYIVDPQGKTNIRVDTTRMNKMLKYIIKPSVVSFD